MVNSSVLFHDFIVQWTNRASPALCPEISLRLCTDFAALWDGQECGLSQRGLAPPYWATPWPGGQALARHLLDNPWLVAGRRVMDLGSGSGLCAIAAALAGSEHVRAFDIDQHACAAIQFNAAENGVSVEVVCADGVGLALTDVDIVIAADLWYERFLALRVNRWLRELSSAGVAVLIGDVGRAYLPRQGLRAVARYEVPDSQGMERNSFNQASVFEFERGRERR